MEAFFNHADASRANANANASRASADSSMPMPPYRRPNVSQNHQILDILRLLIDNYSRSHQMYMIPIESMIYRMNSSSSSPSTDMSMLFHLQNNTHRRMNEYHHTMRDILQLIRQIHQSPPSPPPPVTVSPSTHDQNHPPSHPVSSRIAESILNALLQSSSTTTSSSNPRTSHTGPLTEASFTFSMFAGEDEEEPHLHVTDEQMRQYTETYIFQPPVFTSHYQEDQANEVGSDEPNVRENHRTCPITLEDFEPGESVIKINVCGHVFREAALRSWFERHRMCPVCRRDITVQQS